MGQDLAKTCQVCSPRSGLFRGIRVRAVKDHKIFQVGQGSLGQGHDGPVDAQDLRIDIGATNERRLERCWARTARFDDFGPS